MMNYIKKFVIILMLLQKSIKGGVLLFINEEDRRILIEAQKLVERVYQKTNHQCKEFPSLITALDSLTTAINKKRYR
jgi:hypothetical protein